MDALKRASALGVRFTNPLDSRTRKKYCQLFQECRYRIFALEGFISGESKTLYPQTTIEIAALQLRKILELIAFSSLVSHKDSYIEMRKDIARDWHAERILKKVSQINPNFYPIPVNGAKSQDWNKLKQGFLTRNQFSKLYDRCSDLLHAENPFARKRDPFVFNDSVAENIDRIKLLLQEHLVQLANSNEWLKVFVPFDEGEPIKVEFLIYEK